MNPPAAILKIRIRRVEGNFICHSNLRIDGCRIFGTRQYVKRYLSRHYPPPHNVGKLFDNQDRIGAFLAVQSPLFFCRDGHVVQFSCI